MNQFGRQANGANFDRNIKADIELLAFNAKGLGGEEVAQFVYEDYESKPQRDQQDIVKVGHPLLDQVGFCGKHGRHEA